MPVSGDAVPILVLSFIREGYIFISIFNYSNLLLICYKRGVSEGYMICAQV